MLTNDDGGICTFGEFFIVKNIEISGVLFPFFMTFAIIT